MRRGAPKTPLTERTSGTAEGRAALALQFRRLSAVEALPEYHEMLAAAAARHQVEAGRPRKANGQLMEAIG